MLCAASRTVAYYVGTGPTYFSELFIVWPTLCQYLIFVILLPDFTCFLAAMFTSYSELTSGGEYTSK